MIHRTTDAPEPQATLGFYDPNSIPRTTSAPNCLDCGAKGPFPTLCPYCPECAALIEPDAIELDILALEYDILHGKRPNWLLVERVSA